MATHHKDSVHQSSLLSLFTAGRGLQLLLLSAVMAAVMMAATALTPLQESMRIALGLTDNEIGLLQGPVRTMPVMLGGIPLGLLVDRHSRLRLILVFCGLIMVGNLLTAVASNFALLVVARCLVGLLTPAVPAAMISMLSDLFPSEQRGRAFMFLSFGGIVGASSAFSLGGTLLTHYDLAPDGWRWTLCWLTIPLALVLLLAVAIREPARTGVVVLKPSIRAAFIELWRYRAIIFALQIGMILVGVVDTAAGIWALPALTRNFGVASEHVSNVIATAFLISGIAGPAAGGFLADLCQRSGGPRRGIAVVSALALLSAPAALFALMPGLISAGALLVLFITLGSAIGLMGVSIAIVVIPNEVRGLYIAGLSAVTAFCTGFGPLLVSLLSGAMGGPLMMGKALTLVCLVISLIGSVVLIFARRHFPDTYKTAAVHGS